MRGARGAQKSPLLLDRSNPQERGVGARAAAQVATQEEEGRGGVARG